MNNANAGGGNFATARRNEEVLLSVDHPRLHQIAVFRVYALPVLLDTLGQPLVDGLHHLHTASALQRPGEGGLERLPLFAGRHGRLGVEDGVQNSCRTSPSFRPGHK